MAYTRKQTKKPTRPKDRTCYETAVYLLQFRDQSEKDLTRKLKDREYTEKEIKEAMEKLKGYGYVDDENLGDELFEAYRRRAQYGDSYIHQKLKLKGLSTEKHLTMEEEIDMAAVLLQKKWGISPKMRADFKKSVSFLLRRGFSYDAVMTVMHEMDFEETEE